MNDPAQIRAQIEADVAQATQRFFQTPGDAATIIAELERHPFADHDLIRQTILAIRAGKT